MLAVADNLTLAEFESRFEKSDCSYEYWYGCVIPKSIPTWLHGILQGIIVELLAAAGYTAGSEVELRIDPGARPRPDVIATRRAVENPYPTKAVELIVEILSPEDDLAFVKNKCRAYLAWGFAEIYVVDPQSRSVSRWLDGSLSETSYLSSVPVSEIWTRLESVLPRPGKFFMD